MKPRVVVTPTVHAYQSDAAKKAEKLNITVAEYWRRKRLVTEAVQQIKVKLFEECYPSIYSEYQRYGKIKVTGIVTDYDAYGDVQWNENPYILCVCPIGEPNTVIPCTANYASSEEPIDPETLIGVC